MKMGLADMKIADLPRLDEDARDDACYRGQDRAWSSLVALYSHYRDTEGLSYEKLGWRIKRSRSQVQRWLASSFNMNLKSFGLLAEGLNADVLLDVVPRCAAIPATNYCHPREAARALVETRTPGPDRWLGVLDGQSPQSVDTPLNINVSHRWHMSE